MKLTLGTHVYVYLYVCVRQKKKRIQYQKGDRNKNQTDKLANKRVTGRRTRVSLYSMLQ